MSLAAVDEELRLEADRDRLEGLVGADRGWLDGAGEVAAGDDGEAAGAGGS